MDGQDFELEELLISEAEGLSFEGFDLVVRAFQLAGGDTKVVVCQQPRAVRAMVLDSCWRTLIPEDAARLIQPWRNAAAVVFSGWPQNWRKSSFM